MDLRRQHEFIAGTPALDFVDTFGDRAGTGRERLVDPAALAGWLDQAGLWPDAPPSAPTHAELLAAQSLREAIHRCALQAIHGRAFAQPDLEHLNRAALQMPPRPQLGNGVLRRVSARPVDAALSVLAEDALMLLAGPRRQRIRQCPECAMVFEDTSRPGKRRWCSSKQGCGNRAKVRAHRARRVQDSLKG
ncbi:CGNR zinc finger domain-containing protein [Stenotrophomonas maltophilia]|uniref:CGNR zinc finger domain-containing protein n=1 Tax=Stenotrophomonas maltophilia TaxID=40324 RepID=UPI0034DB3440